MKKRYRRSDRRRRLYWFILGIIATTALISGGLIAYNMLSRSKCDVSLLGDLGSLNVGFDNSSKLLPGQPLVVVEMPGVNPKYEVYIFYDLYCPFCAWEFYESLPLILGYVRDGKIKVYLVDLILHSEARGSHGLLRSIVGRDELYLELFYKSACRLHLDDKTPDVDYLRGLLRGYNITLDDSEVQAEVRRAQSISVDAFKLLVGLQGDPRLVGTPTIVIYNVELERVEHVIPGRVDPEVIDSTLRRLP